jgi:hypothetical protein
MEGGAGKGGEVEAVEETSKEGPEWRHVVIRELRKMQQPKVSCIYCNKEFCGGATRIRAHLLGNRPHVGVAACHVVKTTHPEVVAAMKELQNQKDDLADERLKKRKLYDLSKCMAEASRQVAKQGTLVRSFQAMEAVTVDEAWAKCFYANGIPFRLSEDGYFKDAIKATIQHAQAAYVPPSCWRLSRTLLDSAHVSLSTELQV